MSAAVRRWAAGSLLALAVLGLAATGWRLRSSLNANATMAALLAGRGEAIERGAQRPLPVLLAQAVYLARKERLEEAQDVLAYLTERGDSVLRARAYYNLGNLHLRRALAKVEAGDSNQAIVATAQAKDAFRAALGLDPGHWDSKYNLEAASRLLPTMDRIDSGKDEEDKPDNPKRLWTSVPGFPRGQP